MMRIIKKLVKILYEKNFSEKEIDLISYSRGYWPISLQWFLKGYLPSLPNFVTWPINTEQVSEILKLAKEEKVPVIPYGGGTSVTGGVVPLKGGIVIDLKKMNKIIEINDLDLTVTAEAGINGKILEEKLNSRGYTSRHIPQSLPASTLGGWIATKAAGQFSTKYGKIENLVLGLEAVLPNGEIINSKIKPASSTGPEIEKLFLGSEGTIGVITKATLKIWPLPEEKKLLSFKFKSFTESLEAARKILRKGIYPAVIRLYDEDETELKFQDFTEDRESLGIFIVEGMKEITGQEKKAIERICKNEGAKNCGEEPVKKWLNERFDVITDISQYLPMKVVFDTVEVAATWSKIPTLYRKMKKEISSIEGVLLSSAHASHFYLNGACLYFTIGGIPPEDVKLEDFYFNFWSKAMKACLESGGTISHHHGIGLLRKKWLKEEIGESTYRLLKKIKEVFDSSEIMNPGKLI